jgi:hypothetical protein
MVFLGPSAKEALAQLQISIQTTRTPREFRASVCSLIAFSEHFIRGMSNFSLRQRSASIWTVGLTHPGTIVMLNEYRDTAQAWIDAVDDDAVFDVGEAREQFEGLTNTLSTLTPSLASSVRHQTLREWIYTVSAEVPGDISQLAELYIAHHNAVAGVLCNLMAQSVDITTEWLERALAHYRGHYPPRPVEVIALGLDLAMLYQAQIQHASRALKQHGVADEVESLSVSRLSARDAEDLSGFVAAAFAQWCHEGHFRLSDARLKQYSDPHFWLSMLMSGGSQILCDSQRVSAQCQNNCYGASVSPVALARILQAQHNTSLSTPDGMPRHLPSYDRVAQYIICGSLDDLIDVATYPDLDGSELLVCPTESGWITLMKNSCSDWCVGFVGGLMTPCRHATPVSVPYTFIPDLSARHLGTLPGSISSGVLCNRLLDMADSSMS